MHYLRIMMAPQPHDSTGDRHPGFSRTHRFESNRCHTVNSYMHRSCCGGNSTSRVPISPFSLLWTRPRAPVGQWIGLIAHQLHFGGCGERTRMTFEIGLGADPGEAAFSWLKNGRVGVYDKRN
jgi:hypothetical protein